MFGTRIGTDAFRKLRDEVDQVWRDVSRVSSGAFGASFPALNVWETGDALFIEAELPGLSQDDLELEIVGGELTIKGHRPDIKQQGESYHRQERGTGSFVRRLRLPVDVDTAKIEARLENGVLEIRLPKAEAAKPRKITVNAG
ncbi:MAG: Hsp20/alpha crystallin family protein [Pirellulales bacterium]|nr:Hsp20/alpha crystallin family protein [Pirellulales bacterium]